LIGKGRGDVQPQHQVTHEELRDRTHAQGEHHGAQPGDTAQRDAQRQHHQLDAGAHPLDRPPGTAREAGHQAIARTGAQLRAHVQRSGHRAHHHASKQIDPAQQEGVRRVEQLQVDVGERPQQQRVGQRAQAGHLPQRNPQQQYPQCDQHHDGAQRQRQMARRAFMEHHPGRSSQGAAHQQRVGDAIQPQPGQQPRQALGQPAGAKLVDRAQIGQAQGRSIQVHGGQYPGQWHFHVAPVRP